MAASSSMSREAAWDAGAACAAPANMAASMIQRLLDRTEVMLIGSLVVGFVVEVVEADALAPKPSGCRAPS